VLKPTFLMMAAQAALIASKFPSLTSFCSAGRRRCCHSVSDWTSFIGIFYVKSEYLAAADKVRPGALDRRRRCWLGPLTTCLERESIKPARRVGRRRILAGHPAV
jgi:hypothetical protein